VPIEFFLVPVVGTGTRADPRRAKYSTNPGVIRHGMIRYSHADDCIAMFEAAQADLDTLAGQSDVTRIATEANLNGTMNASQRTTLINALNARQIPSQWVAAGLTRRAAIRTVCWMFALVQRLEGRFDKPFHDQAHQWLAGGGLRNVAGHEDEPIPTDAAELARQGKILLGLQFQELPSGVQNYLLEVRDKQGWTNQDLGLTATSTVKDILRSFGSQGVGIRKRLAKHGLTLASTWADFPQAMRDELQDAVESFGFDAQSLGFTGTTALRTMMKTFADQFAGRELWIGGVAV
jgi:hypothetical protein